MKAITNTNVALFYAIPAFGMLGTLVILIFIGATNFNDTIDMVRFMFIESEEKAMFYLFTISMFICFLMSVIVKIGLINTLSRSILNLITSITIMLVSFIYLGEFLGLICIPVVIYSFLFYKQLHNKSLNRIGANNAPPG